MFGHGFGWVGFPQIIWIVGKPALSEGLLQYVCVGGEEGRGGGCCSLLTLYKSIFWKIFAQLWEFFWYQNSDANYCLSQFLDLFSKHQIVTEYTFIAEIPLVLRFLMSKQ